MNPKRTLRRVGVALMLLVAFLFQGTWALAGTTGGIAGYVRETSGAPVADATLKAVSPSGVASSRTDATGHFIFLSLSPDTYTITVSKEGFADESVPGVVVFADQTQTLNITQDKKLSTIARVKSVSAGSLVKSGVTSDTYSINAATASKAAALGGGGNMDQTYSAIASVPGVVVPTGGTGWGQNVYIRGSQGDSTSFEYDGIPVNRAFDNYNSSTESNLGLQELQVYTGGAPASNSSAGTSGFINQVIKTGTYPGYAQLSGGLGTSAFYHMAKVEAGGASPDRNFSYYVGVSGVNQDVRYFNNSNGASLMTPGGVYSGYSYAADGLGNSFGQGAIVDCLPGTSTPVATQTAPGCLLPFFGLTGATSYTSDRENVVNFHFGIPRKNGQRDDLQLLYSSSALVTQFYGSANDLGAAAGVPGLSGANAISLAVTGNPNGVPIYQDALTYNLPFGASVVGVAPSNYFQPSSPQNRAPGSQIPSAYRDTVNNDTGIVKLSYTHPLSDRAYLRAFGYTFFSDWTQAGALDAYGYYSGSGYSTGASPNYDLITHTAGGELQFADQINDKNLVELTGNYTTANVVRDNNTGFLAGASPIGTISGNSTAGYQCWNEKNPAAVGYDTAVPCYSSSYKSNSAAGIPATSVIGPNGTAAGAQWSNLWNGNSSGAYNTVKPKFGFLSLTDQFRPNDKWLFNGGLRYESYTYGLQSSNTPANNFYAQIVNQYTCYAPGYGVATQQLPPGVPPPAGIQYVSNPNCNAGLTADGVVIPAGVTYEHPYQTSTPFTANSPSSFTQNFYSLSASGTYTASPDTVWRFSAGRHTQPPISASMQYLYNSGAGNTLWSNFESLGFFSPAHDIPSQSSGQYDLSLERHIRGTDVSFKLTPFYNLTSGYQADAFIGQGFVTQVPIGQFRSYGVEASLTKGDFSRNGLSGSLSVTYTKAQLRFQSEFNGALPNQMTTVQNAINAFDALTKGGGGSPCYKNSNDPTNTTPGLGDGTNCGSPNDVLNPYYNMATVNAKAAFPTNGWYAPITYVAQPGVYTQPGFYDTPWNAALILNYRKNKFAVTPSLQFVEGTSYGTPFDVTGYDPRVCGANSAASGIATTGTNPQQCNYLQLTGSSASPVGPLYIPNPQTGSFAGYGGYREPSLITGNIAFSYDVTPKVTAQLTATNIFHTCFGGTKAPWTSAYPTGQNTCGYNVNGLYVSNYQNGAGQLQPGNVSAYDSAANGVSLYPWESQSYTPRSGSPGGNGATGAQLPLPINLYFNVQIKL